MYLHEDKVLREAVDNLIAECDKHDIKVTIAATSEAGVDKDGDQNVQYSSLGNTAISSKHYAAMYADYANDLLQLLGPKRADALLNSHLQILTDSYWKYLEATKNGAH